MTSGAYLPVIDRIYPLDEIVEANRYVESERKTGNVVLSIGASTAPERWPGGVRQRRRGRR
jgi:hypothetical protein